MDLKGDFAQSLKVFVEDTERVEEARKRGMIVVKVAPDLIIIHEDIKKPWQPGGPTVVPEPREEQPRSKPAELLTEKHPIDVETEKRKQIDDFWNGLK